MAAVIIALVPLVFLCWRVLFLGETFGDRDLASYYHPAKRLIAALTQASGGVPSWNPFFGSGQPFAANPEHEVFYPLTTLFFVLPFEVAFRLQVILPLLVALPSMYFLLRTLRRSQPASLFGALAWAFGGYLLSTTNLLPQLFAGAPLPLTLALGIRILRKPSALTVAGLALCFGSQCLVGEPSTLVVVPLRARAAAFAERRRTVKGGLACALLALLLGGAIGAATLVPGAHHVGKTARANGLPLSEAGEWSMPAARLLDLVTPHALGHVVPNRESDYWGGSLYGQRKSPYFYSLYPGLLVSLLALVAWGQRWRVLFPWIVVTGFGFLLALGLHTPVWPMLRRLPLLHAIRFPEKYVLLSVLPLLVAASYGFDQILLGHKRARRWFARWLAVPAILGFLAAAAVQVGAAWLPRDFPRGQTVGDALRVSVVATFALVLFQSRRGLGRRARGLVVCALLALDLATAGVTIVRTTPIAKLTSPPRFFLSVLNRSEDQLLFHSVEWDPTMHDLDGIAKPPIPAQWGLALTLEKDFDRTFLQTTNLATQMFWQAVRSDPSLQSTLLRRRGVTALLRVRPGARWVGDHVVGPDDSGVLEVLASNNSRPLLSSVARLEAVSGASGWLSTALRLRDEMRDTACVDDPHLPSFSNPLPPADIRMASRAPNHLAAAVLGRGPAPSFVAFNQSWDEGWQLRVDGRPEVLFRTDISLSGFFVPPGPHQVELEYRDPWISAGLAISVAAALICLGLVFAHSRRSRRLGDVD